MSNDGLPGSRAGGSSGEEDPDLVVLAGTRWRGEEVPGERSAALLAALVLAAPRPVSAEQLVGEVWDEAPEHPEKALQVLVSRTRSRTAPSVIERGAGGYRLGLDRSRVDLLRLRTLVEDGRSSWSPDPLGRALDVEVTPPGGDDANGSARGRLLAEALRLQDGARRLLGQVLLDRGDSTAALPLLEQALQQHPEDEAVLAAVLRAEAMVRGVPAALERYAAHTARVREALGSEPGEELRRLHADLLARDAPVREGLAYDATPLVGRDHDLAELRGLSATSKVVTIVGAGGLGKTRMAHRVGRSADQPVVQFVGLAGVSTPEGLLTEVASALGVRDSLTGLAKQRNDRPRELRGRIAEQLSGPRTLLILDNCEHVIDAAADLVAFLVAVTGNLQVLATSRAPLGIAAEHVYKLPQLEPDAAADLFGQRARAARSDVELAPAEVADLVARLDGLPLAIELAAAKVRVMTVPEITRRLEDRFALLRGGDRSAPERHRTLLAVIEWSWNLLEEPDRRALRWLSAFPDGFGLEGAQVLLGHDPLAEVADLVEQSLLVVQPGLDGRPSRYCMLETVREYAARQLSDSGEDAAATAAVRGWALDLARRESERVQSRDQVSAVARLTAEEGNLSSLLRRAIQDRDVTAVLVLGAALTGVWSIRGEHVTVVETARDVEDLVVGAEEDPETATELRSLLALLAMNQLIFASQMDEAAHARLRELGPGGGPPSLQGTIRVLLAIGSGDDPGPLGRLRADPDPAVATVACQFMSQALENAGDLAGAREALERALGFDVRDEGPWTRALLHSMMAGLSAQAGEVDLAVVHAREAIPVMDALGATEDSIQLRATLVCAQLARGDDVAAEATIAEADRLEHRRETLSWRFTGLLARAELALARGQTQEGLALYREAAEANRIVRRPWLADLQDLAPWLLFTEAAALAAHVLHDTGEQAVPRRRSMAAGLRDKLPRVLGSARHRLDFPVTGGVLYALGCWALDEGQHESGARLLCVARSFGYQQQMPTMRWALGEHLAEQRAPGVLERWAPTYADIPPRDLIPEAAELVAGLDTC